MGDVDFGLAGDVGMVELDVGFEVAEEDVGGLGLLVDTADGPGRAVLVGSVGPVGAVLVGEVVGVAEVGAAVGDREPVVGVRLGRGVVPVGGECCGRWLGAGASNSSWAGRCRRAGSAPAAAATASPVTAANTAAAAMPTRVVNRAARRSTGAG